MTLTEAQGAIGQTVIYRASPEALSEEVGEITDVGHAYVFVRFRGDLHRKACRAEDLRLMAEDR